MPINPCCGGSLQRGSKIVAIIEIVWYSLVVLCFIGLLVAVLVFGIAFNFLHESKSEQDHQRKAVTAVFSIMIAILLVFNLIGYIISLIMSIILYTGATQRNKLRCLIWVAFRGVMWCLMLVSLLMGNPLGLFELLLTPYFVWVVVAYIEEISRAGGQGVVYSVAGQGTVYSAPPAQQEMVAIHNFPAVQNFPMYAPEQPQPPPYYK